MQFGSREQFRYFECADCQCLQLVEVPEDLFRHYPATYESLNIWPPDLFRSDLRGRLEGLRTRFILSGKGVLGRLLYAKWPAQAEIGLRALSLIAPRTTDRIIDVGCGTGHRLYELRHAGFRHLLGIDPFIEAGIDYPNGLNVRKQTLEQVTGEWDIIMFHHSFEHLHDPLATLRQASRLLAGGGYCLIRTPTTSSWAWEHYRDKWAQIDAPRHITIPSEKTLQILAAKAGLSIQRIEYDSTEFQFLASDFYMENISWNEAVNRADLQPRFSAEAISILKRRADKLNEERRGDQFVCLMTKM
jgi:SAM-dependent methyltransferase